MSLNDLLQQRLGPDAANDLEKTAQFEHFIKVAQYQNVPLHTMTEEQVGQLYEQFTANVKAAAEAPEESDEDKEKRELVEKARKEHAEKTASVKIAEEYREMGREMARGFRADMLEAQSKEAMVSGRRASEAAKAVAEKAVNEVTKKPSFLDRATPAVLGAIHKTEDAVRAHPGRAAGAAVAGTAALAGGAAAAHHAMKDKDEKKEGSADVGAYELTAANVALDFIANAGWDAKEASARLNAVLTLGLPEYETSKTAALQSFEAGIETRALEYCLAAGYELREPQGLGMTRMKVAADSVVSGHEPDHTTAAVPQTSILTSPAPGKRGPIGSAPRTNYSRVNTGMSSMGEPGGGGQSMQSPMGLNNLPKLASKDTNMDFTPRPTLQVLVKQATLSGLRAGWQDASARAGGTLKTAADMTEDEKRKKEEAAKKGKTEKDADCKMASADVEKLAAALYELAEEEEKSAEGPGAGPGALHVTETAAPAAISHDTGKARTQLPASTMGKGAPAQDPKTQMANDVNNPPGGSAPQQTSLTGSGHKHASDGAAILRMLKQAEDAINPARISAGSASTTTLPTMETGERPAPVPTGASLVSSNEAAENFTRGQAKAQERADLGKVLDEPALSTSTDKDLQNALAHNSGSKVASLDTLAAQAYLQKLAAALPSTTPTAAPSARHPEY